MPSKFDPALETAEFQRGSAAQRAQGWHAAVAIVEEDYDKQDNGEREFPFADLR